MTFIDHDDHQHENQPTIHPGTGQHPAPDERNFKRDYEVGMKNACMSTFEAAENVERMKEASSC